MVHLIEYKHTEEKLAVYTCKKNTVGYEQSMALDALLYNCQKTIIT